MQRVRSSRRDLQRLFDQHVQAVARGRDALFAVQARGASDGHEVHRSMAEKSLEVVVGDGVVLAGETRGLLRIAAIDGGNLEPRQLRAARMCVSVMPPAPMNPTCMTWNSSGCWETPRHRGSPARVGIAGRGRDGAFVPTEDRSVPQR